MRNAEHVAGVEQGREDRQCIAGRIAGSKTAQTALQHDNAADRDHQPNEKGTADKGAEKQPGGYRDEDRCQIGQKRRIGDRGHMDRGMPGNEISGEKDTRQNQRDPVAHAFRPGDPMLTGGAEDDEQGNQRQGYPPEGRRHRPDF